MPVLRHSLQAWLTGKVRSVSWRKCWTLPTVLLLLWSGYTLRIFLCSRCNLTYFTMNELTSIDAEAGGCGTTSHLVSFFFFPLLLVLSLFVIAASPATVHAFGVLVKTHSTAILICVCQIVNRRDEEARLIFCRPEHSSIRPPTYNAEIPIVAFFFLQWVLL